MLPGQEYQLWTPLGAVVITRTTYYVHHDCKGAELHFGSRNDEGAITITTAVTRRMFSVQLTRAAASELGRRLSEWSEGA